MLLISSTTHAQFGFKGGLNISRFADPGTISGASALVAGNFGIVNKNQVNSIISIQKELSASWEGEKCSNAIAYGTFNFTYLNLPILARLKLGEALYAETGPQFGLQLSAKVTSTANQGSNQILSDIISINLFAFPFGIHH